MGISKLAELVRTDAPAAIAHREISHYTGKIIALDASIVLCQFRTAGPKIQNRNGTFLSPLTGLFFRTLHFLENDIKPVFVFEGIPPAQKSAVLEKRAAMQGWSHRTSTESPQTQDCQRLLQLLGVPFIQAAGEGEAMCAQLVRCGRVDAVASEDMDTLAFGSSLLIRQLNAKKSNDIVEYSLPKLLDILGLTQEQFVDLCILLGCDYCEKIHGLGPRKALDLIQEHKTIENVLLNINRETHPVPLCWKYQDARRLFLDLPGNLASDQPDQLLCWEEPDEEGLVQFLCREKYVREERVRGRMERFRKTLQERRKERQASAQEGCSQQTCMDQFFRVTRRRQAPDAEEQSSSKKSRLQS
ncbi:probable flap endonuclease 1 homolog [Amia ocellicauda]|uniref:probable flap endonuclease 1 homolog n=1 Tax=Amia ocellicauda TaxID=2972642 RepID=UPI0034644D89